MDCSKSGTSTRRQLLRLFPVGRCLLSVGLPGEQQLWISIRLAATFCPVGENECIRHPFLEDRDIGHSQGGGCPAKTSGESACCGPNRRASCRGFPQKLNCSVQVQPPLPSYGFGQWANHPVGLAFLGVARTTVLSHRAIYQSTIMCPCLSSFSLALYFDSKSFLGPGRFSRWVRP